MPAPKIIFTPERQAVVKEATCFKASISGNGVLVLLADYTKAYELDGKFIQVYKVETPDGNGIGWKIVEGYSFADLNVCRKCKVIPKAECVKLSVAKLMGALGVEMKPYKKMDILRYTPTSLLEKGEYFYVILKK